MLIPDSYKLIVIGLGAHGSSALYQLSKTGKRILGIDRFAPPHRQGSSHGESRIIRQAYHENPLYVPLVKAAYPLWTELEAVSGRQLFLKTGGLLLGVEDAAVVNGARLSAETHNIPYEWLDAAEIRRRFPAFKASSGTVGVLEKEAGVLFPEECIRSFLQAAAGNGAEIRLEEPVVAITPDRDGVLVTTTKGSYRAEKLILSAGAWLNNLLPELRLPLTIERQVLCWFDNADVSTRASFQPAAMPIFLWEWARDRIFYGFPDLGRGVKVAHHHAGRAIEPDALSQEGASEAEISEIKNLAGTLLAMTPVYRDSSVCMYTNAPDEDFIIDFHPLHPNILIASPCSGHGFKFSSLIGKLLAELALEGKTGYDLSAFAIDRRRLG